MLSIFYFKLVVAGPAAHINIKEHKGFHANMFDGFCIRDQNITENISIKGSVREKLKGSIGLRRKIIAFDRY